MKCPVCNSSRILKDKNGMKCLKCGYLNNKNEKKNNSSRP